jgi:predicted nucleic acid-binding protein
MSDDQVFVDTNILVYAHNKDAGDKYRIAKEKVKSLWNRPLPPSISIQVLQEFYVNLIRKTVNATEARETVLSYLEWDVIDNDRLLLLDGMRMKEKWSLSCWDALILAAAKRAKARELWSEDLNPGRNYEGLVVVNPLAKALGI